MRQGRRRVGAHSGAHLEPELQRAPLGAVLHLLRAPAGRSPAPRSATGPAPGPARRARPRRSGPHAPAPGSAPAAARRARRRRTPRGAPPAGGRRRTSGERVCRARPTRSAGTPSCGFRWSRSWRTRPRIRPTTASSGAAAAAPSTPAAARGTPDDRAARAWARAGAAPSGCRSSAQAGHRARAAASLPSLSPSSPLSSLLSSSAPSSSGSSGIGLASSCWVSAQAAMVTPVYSVPSSNVAVVTASEQRKPFQRQALRPWQLVVSRVESYVHAAGAVGALAVVAVLARVGAALPAAVADRLAALPPVVGLLVVGGGLAGAVLGAVRRVPPRPGAASGTSRAGRAWSPPTPSTRARRTARRLGRYPRRRATTALGRGSLGRGGRGGDLRDAVHARLTSFSGVRARATSSRSSSGRSVSA